MPRPGLCQERLSSIQSGTGSQMTTTTTTTPCTTSGTLPGRSVRTGRGTRHLAPSPLPLPTALRPGMTPLGAEMSVTCPWSHNLQAAEQRFEPEEVWFPNPYSLPVCYVPLRHTSTLVVQALGRPWGAKPTRSCPQDVYSQWEATTDITRGKNAVTEKTRCSDSTRGVRFACADAEGATALAAHAHLLRPSPRVSPSALRPTGQTASLAILHCDGNIMDNSDNMTSAHRMSA